MKTQRRWNIWRLHGGPPRLIWGPSADFNEACRAALRLGVQCYTTTIPTHMVVLEDSADEQALRQQALSQQAGQDMTAQGRWYFVPHDRQYDPRYWAGPYGTREAAQQYIPYYERSFPDTSYLLEEHATPLGVYRVEYYVTTGPCRQGPYELTLTFDGTPARAQRMISPRVQDSSESGIAVEIAGIHCLNREPAAEDGSTTSS